MYTSTFSFDLPSQAIATEPRIAGADARLLVLRRATGAIEHCHVADLPSLLGDRYHIVANDSAVLPSTVAVASEEGATTEVALSRDVRDGRWRPLGRPSEVVDPHGVPTAAGLPEAARRWAQLSPEEAVMQLARSGQVTFPRYLAHLKHLYPTGVPDFYLNAWSAEPGSVAPPSAGLNIGVDVLKEVLEAGATFSTMTVHIGHVTFRRPQPGDLKNHKMEGEGYELSSQSAGLIEAAVENGRRILAVGTSTTRALEHIAATGDVSSMGNRGVADLFIRPGYDFGGIDAIFTGLHGPETTLFMLICAFGGREKVFQAYHEALDRGYRWYTLGDSMLIL